MLNYNGERGWYPHLTERVVIPAKKLYLDRNYGVPLAVVMHIAQGTYRGTIEHFTRSATISSSTFLIGLNGEVAQFCSIYQRAMANGLNWYEYGEMWIDPQSHVVKPTWELLQRGSDPNKTTVSIEHAGYSNRPRTPRQNVATVNLLHWIKSETGIVWVAHRSLIGHNEISPISRAFCPGPNIDLEGLARQANRGTLSVPPNNVARPRSGIYRVSEDNARMRKAPWFDERGAVFGKLKLDSYVNVVGFVSGALYQHSNQWAELLTGGVVWSGLLERVRK